MHRNVLLAQLRSCPPAVQHYVVWLETDADPAGTLQRNWELTIENAALRKLLEGVANGDRII